MYNGVWFYFLKGANMQFDIDLYNDVTKILNSLKISTDLSGFEYLRKGIILCFLEDEYLENITTRLYPVLAKEYKTNSITVERNIRSAIESAFNIDGLRALNLYYDMIIYRGDCKLTNSELIFIIIEILKLKDLKMKYCEDCERNRA